MPDPNVPPSHSLSPSSTAASSLPGPSAAAPPAPPPVSPFCTLATKDLPAASQAHTAWLWDGYLAPGNVTLLTSQWKSGKTTLVAVLLSRMARGGQLAGLAVRPGRAVIISEESHLNWQQRNQKLHFGDNVSFLCRPFPGKPTVQE